MDIGMLWFDNDKEKDLQAKLLRAVDYYRTKYGKKPDLCFVHPGMLRVAPVVVAGVELRTSVWIMPNHFWIGMRQAQAVSA